LAHARRIRPDLIHTHRFKENVLGGVVAFCLRIPSLRTAHGAPEPGLLTGFRRLVVNGLDKFVARRLQRAVVAVSEDLGRHLRGSYPGAYVPVIPNGIEVAEVLARARESSTFASGRADVLSIGFVGRLVPIKRVDILLRSAAALRDLIAVSFELVIVGDGPERATLENLADELCVRDIVRFVGFQKNAAGWIRSMKCIALTSDHEGLPMIVLESLALGVPVVARAVGGIPEILGKVNSAWLVNGSGADEFAAALASALSTDFAATSHSMLPLEYSAESMVGGYLKLYGALLGTGEDSMRVSVT
jgi:glycosyltransferase involved in cell wall biosynthesis